MQRRLYTVWKQIARGICQKIANLFQSAKKSAFADFFGCLTFQGHKSHQILDDLAADDEAGDGGHKGVGTGD